MQHAIFRLALVAAAVVSALGQTSAQSSSPMSAAIVPPAVMREVKPDYPEEALGSGLAGSVELECVVNADGMVGEIKILKPLHPLLDAEAVKALRHWLFKPATREGKPVPVAVTIEMAFTALPPGPKLDSPEVFKPGGDVTTPRVLKDVRPPYTAESMRERVSGAVEIECVVLQDGSVGDARVSKSLHPQLDREALRAARQWRFEPGLKDGQPVPVQVTITMTFTLK